MPSKYENMTIEELKKMCRQKNISGYSKLNKLDLIKLYKKNSRGKKVNQNKTKINYKKMKGGEPTNLRNTALKRFTRETKELNLIFDINYVPMSETYYKISYNENIFYISFPINYPFRPPTINGLTPIYWHPMSTIKDQLDNLIISGPDAKNTLVYCHDNKDHWLANTWDSLFGDNFTNSNKIYFDLKALRTNNITKTKIYQGNGFNDDFLFQNNNLWDYIMDTDCGVIPKNEEFGGFFTYIKKGDLDSALILLNKMLLNLKIGGNLFLAKTITNKFIEKMKLELGTNYQIKLLELAYKNYLGNNEIYYKYKNNNVVTNKELDGVVINRIM